MLPEDSIETALPIIQVLNDTRLQHLYDTERMPGKKIAMSVGWEGHVAWDIFRFYSPGILWTDLLPKPTRWVHQVSDEWAKNDHYHTGENFKRELSYSFEFLMG